MNLASRFQKIEIKSSDQLRQWLQTNHPMDESVWLITYKKTVPEFYVSFSEIVDQLLCYGWIDSTIRKVDERRVMRLISKRRRGSQWSAVNKKKVTELINQGLMMDAGLKAIQRAKKDGSWTFLDDVDNLIVPTDLTKELQRYPKAFENFKNFPKSAQRVALTWVKSARANETRERRIIEVAFLAQENIRAPLT